MTRTDKDAILARAIATGHQICPNGHYFMDGSWRWNKGHKQCLICRMLASSSPEDQGTKKPSTEGTNPGRGEQCKKTTIC
jgi:hypothetical protein